MDDQSAYLLGGILTRHFGLGRIARFREVQRGRQAPTLELLTAQQNEYLIYMYPPAFPVERLAFMASAINRLDQTRFSVLPFQKARDGGFVADGPQNSHLLVGLNPSGVALPAAEWTDHQLSELGLRLAWMHRALREELPAPEPRDVLAELQASLALPPDKLPRNQPAIPPALRDNLLANLRDLPPAGRTQYIHADLHPDAIVLDADRQLRVVLDWALLQPASPLEDLFWVLAGWGDLQRLAIVLEAYRAMEPVEPAKFRRAVFDALARRIIDARAGRTALRPVLELLPRAEAFAAAAG